MASFGRAGAVFVASTVHAVSAKPMELVCIHNSLALEILQRMHTIVIVLAELQQHFNSQRLLANLMFTNGKCFYNLASFPGPAQLFVACSTEKRGEPGMFPHVSIM